MEKATFSSQYCVMTIVLCIVSEYIKYKFHLWSSWILQIPKMVTVSDFSKLYMYMKFEVLTVMNIKTAVLWHVKLCNLINGYHYPEHGGCLVEMWVTIYQTEIISQKSAVCTYM
jgi:hypothetical protein